MNNKPEETVLPYILRKNQRIAGRTWVAGSGPRNARVMFITPCILEEEAAEEKMLDPWGKEKAPREPRMGECTHGLLLKDLAAYEEIDMEECFLTSIIKYLPDSVAHRSKPTKTMQNHSLPLLEADIAEIKPDIICCLGKPVFDLLMPITAREADIAGVWFSSEKYNCKIYPMLSYTQLIMPEKHERYIEDLRAVKTMLNSIDGLEMPKVETEYSTINNSTELLQLVIKLQRENRTILSVDCEWEGQQHVDGKLRSLQICWEAGKAAYIRFMGEELDYTFDTSYEGAGRILGIWLNRPEVKYIGHHVSADLAWMSYWLKLDWYDKAIFDSEFALQCVDESLPLGLDDLALRFTDLGRYDWDLLWYRKTHPERRGDGYGLVPDEIIIPYGCKDVDTVMRAYPIITEKLAREGLTDYYNNISNPFVTNVFTSFCLRGIPMNLPKMDEMRKLYNWAREELLKEFQITMCREADSLLANKLEELIPEKAEDVLAKIKESALTEDAAATAKLARKEIGAEHISVLEPFVDHYLEAPNFNIQSKPQVVRWLFKVKEYTPIVSTKNKAAGTPAVSWSKVLTYPPDKQKLYIPATDKQSMEILSAKHKDETLGMCLELKSVISICKSFLREADIDEETGELIKENGLHYWVASDGAAHLMHSCTETGEITIDYINN